MIFDKTDKFETSESRYSKLKGDFRRMYLSPRAWNHEYGRQNVQVYKDLVYYLDKAIQVRDHPALDILTENINLVLQYLPISPRRREEHIAFIEAGKPIDKLRRIKTCLERESLKNEMVCSVESELLGIRQKIYSKLKKGQNVFSMMKMFKRKVNMLLVNYRADMCFEKKKNWIEKVIITEKAVVRNKDRPIVNLSTFAKPQPQLEPSRELISEVFIS